MKDKPIYYMDGATTVCLLPKDGMVVARGIAICSRLDDFDGAAGRKHAFARAQEAAGRRNNCGEIRLNVERNHIDLIHLSLARDHFGGYKGHFHPKLTKTELIVIDLKANGSSRNRT